MSDNTSFGLAEKDQRYMEINNKIQEAKEYKDAQQSSDEICSLALELMDDGHYCDALDTLGIARWRNAPDKTSLYEAYADIRGELQEKLERPRAENSAADGMLYAPLIQNIDESVTSLQQAEAGPQFGAPGGM